MIIKKVLVAGTFDILHPGHIFFINEAAKLGEVYVIVATDKNREKFSGKLPIIPEEQRLEVVSSLKNVKQAKLGRKDNEILLTVSEINPDIILLGPDQKFDGNLLKKALIRNNLGYIEVRRLHRYYDKYVLNSSSLIKRKIIESNDRDEKKKRMEIKYPTNYGEV
ncbi:MAG: FAD synthase [Promethearchaeota archaeon]|nr:MAG: FAD synthase [Candidatus Lokiarchaeota archaeon]